MTFQPRVWLNLLIPPLRTIEKVALEALIEELDSDIRDIAVEQIGLINLVQRFAADREVNLYSVPGGIIKGSFPRRLPGSRQEDLLGEVDLAIASMELTAGIWAARGRVFSIVFNRTPPRRFVRSDIRVVGVRLGDQASARGYRGTLPADFQHVLARHKSGDLRLDGITLLSPAEVYEVHTEDTDFLVLALVADTGVLAIPAGANGGPVTYLGFDGEPATPLADTMDDAISRLSKLRHSSE